MKTTAAILYELNQPLRIEEIALPPLRAGQVRVSIAYSGVCHTQLHEVRGRRGDDRFLPHTLGHEGSGVVSEIGESVTKVRPGDHVVLSWIRGSGKDVPSTTYKSGDITINSGAISTFMRDTITCESRVTQIPPDVPLREAALFGCAVPTGMGIVVNTAGLRPGASVAVFGAGGIGLSAIMGAALMQGSPVIAVDVHENKLEMARRLGATHTINAVRDDAIAMIRQLTDGRGVDVAIEAAGQRTAMEAAFESARPAGGLCVIAGNLPFGERFSVDPMSLIRGKRLVGSWGGESDLDRDMPRYVDLLMSRRLKVDALVTDVYAFDTINDALSDLEQGKVARALIDCR